MVPHILKKAEISNNEAGVRADNFNEPKSQALGYFKDSHIFSFCQQRKAGLLWAPFDVSESRSLQNHHSSPQLCTLDRNLQFLRANESDACWLSRKWAKMTCFQLRWLHKGPAQNNYEWFLYNAKLPFYSRVEQLPFKTIRVVFCLCVRVTIVVYCRLFCWQRTG